MTSVIWIQAAINLVLLAALFASRIWIKASIEKRVQHQFDEKIESVRTELRKSEEKFKQEMQAREAEISALRDGVMGGRATRQAIIDKRRLEAVRAQLSVDMRLVVQNDVQTMNCGLRCRRCSQ
jgi:cell division protein FtsB